MRHDRHHALVTPHLDHPFVRGAAGWYLRALAQLSPPALVRQADTRRRVFYRPTPFFPRRRSDWSRRATGRAGREDAVPQLRRDGPDRTEASTERVSARGYRCVCIFIFDWGGFRVAVKRRLSSAAWAGGGERCYWSQSASPGGVQWCRRKLNRELCLVIMLKRVVIAPTLLFMQLFEKRQVPRFKRSRAQQLPVQ